jgi:hypothetical protein
MERKATARSVAQSSSAGIGRAIAPLRHIFVVFAAGLFAVFGLACSTPTANRESLPIGWITHRYGGIEISTPKGWVVQDPPTCPDPPASGTLQLGQARTVINCQVVGVGTNVVDVTPLLMSPFVRTELRESPSRHVNNIVVYAPKNAFGTQWLIPSLGLVVGGQGPAAGKVLSTIRRK